MHFTPCVVEAVSTTLRLPGIRCHGVSRQHPAPLAQLVCQIKLSVLARLLFAILVDCLGQAERHQRQRIVFAQDPEVACHHTSCLAKANDQSKNALLSSHAVVLFRSERSAGWLR